MRVLFWPQSTLHFSDCCQGCTWRRPTKTHCNPLFTRSVLPKRSSRGACIRMCTYVDIYTYMYIYIYICIHTYTSMPMYIHISIYTYICAYIYTHTYMYIYIHIHIYTYAYIHIYIHMDMLFFGFQTLRRFKWTRKRPACTRHLGVATTF